MAILQMTVKGQELKIRNPLIVAKTVNYIDAEISLLSDAWNGLDVFLHFEKNGTDKAYIVEVLDGKAGRSNGINLDEGTWEIWVHGQATDDDGNLNIRITTEKQKVYVKSTGSINGGIFPDYEPTIVEKLVDEAIKARDTTQKYRDESETSSLESKKYADNAGLYANKAALSEENAEAYKNKAESYRDDAGESARIASVYSNFASSKATEAQKSATNAQTSYEKARDEATKAENSSSFANTSKLDAMGYASKAYEYKEQARKYAESGDIEIRKEISELVKDVTEQKGEINQLNANKISKPEDAPVVGKVLKIKSVNDDGTFVCEWAEAPEPDLTGYVQKTNFNAGFGLQFSDGNVKGVVDSATSYAAKGGSFIVSKGTLNNIKENLVTSVIDFRTGGNPQTKRIVEESDLEHYVKDTDYASASNAGVFKLESGYGVSITSVGNLRALSYTEPQFAQRGEYTFVSKGTLENIKENLVKSVVGGDFKKVIDVTATVDNANLIFNVCDDGLPLNRYSSAIVWFESPKQDGVASVGRYGQIYFDDENNDTLFIAENGAYTQASGASAHGMYAECIVNRGVRVSTGGVNTTHSNNPTLKKRYIEGFGSVVGTSVDNAMRKIGRIRLFEVTGTYHILVFAAE